MFRIPEFWGRCRQEVSQRESSRRATPTRRMPLKFLARRHWAPTPHRCSETTHAPTPRPALRTAIQCGCSSLLNFLRCRWLQIRPQADPTRPKFGRSTPTAARPPQFGGGPKRARVSCPDRNRSKFGRPELPIIPRPGSARRGPASTKELVLANRPQQLPRATREPEIATMKRRKPAYTRAWSAAVRHANCSGDPGVMRTI